MTWLPHTDRKPCVQLWGTWTDREAGMLPFYGGRHPRWISNVCCLNFQLDKLGWNIPASPVRLRGVIIYSIKFWKAIIFISSDRFRRTHQTQLLQRMNSKLGKSVPTARARSLSINYASFNAAPIFPSQFAPNRYQDAENNPSRSVISGRCPRGQSPYPSPNLMNNL